MSDGRIGEFSIRLGFDDDEPTVTVVGDVDIVTATNLSAVINALIEGDYRTIVVDLSELTFIDAQGLNVLAETASRINQVAGTLTVRAAPQFTRSLLDITGITGITTMTDDLVSSVTDPEPDPAPAPGHQRHDGELEPVGEAALPLHTDPRTLARSETDLIDAALRLVTSIASATVENADGVSVTLERHGRLMTVAASNDAVLTMDHHQYETGEGPCLDAKALGRYFYIESLARETRWPKFVPLALEQGIHSILSSPLMTHDKPQGALNIYSSANQAFGTREQELAALFAEQASEILTTASQGLTGDESKQRFAQALTARQTIHQAQGVLMALHDLSADEAIRSLFAQAREAELAVVIYAHRVIAALDDEPT